MTLLLFYLFVALLVSFLCSVLEAVLLSSSPTFIEMKINEQKKYANKFKSFKIDIDKPISAILSINTIAHTVGAAGVGAQAIKVFGEEHFAVISAILTFLILFFSEIIPKTIGAVYWKNLLPFSTFSIQLMIYITYPLVYLSNFISYFFSGGKHSTSISREELSAINMLGAKEGIIDEHESKIIHNLFRLKSIRIKEIMTPRTVFFAAEENENILDFFKENSKMQFSRIPIYSETIDNITGYVLKTSILENIANSKTDLTLKEIKREALFTPENLSIPRLFEKLIQHKEHIAIIIDEYGGVEGLISMEDIIETILGLEITDESDKLVDLQQYARDKAKSKINKMNMKH